VAELRPATEDDVEVIAAMQLGSLVETYEPFLGRTAVDVFLAGGNVERYFRERWRKATVATHHGKIVGVAVLEGTLLDLLWVDTARRSQGIGGALLEEAERQAALAGDELVLEVWRVNRRAVKFYERHGFTITRAFDDPETGLEKLAMRKAL
jgi:ribosomal protein S18 acetylase RimI-like enzyme